MLNNQLILTPCNDFMSKFQNGTSRLSYGIKNVALLTIPFFAGLLVSYVMAMIPSAGGLLTIHLSPFVIAVLVLSSMMVYGLRSCLRNPRNMLVFISMIISYMTIIYLDRNETPTEISYDSGVMYCLLVFVYLIAILPFFSERNVVSFQRSNVEIQSVSFAASIMWFSPFFAEMLIWLRWYAFEDLSQHSLMIFGWYGTNDLLFRFGLWALVSMTSFHILRRLLFKVK